MTRQARADVLRLLDQGKIHAGALPSGEAAVTNLRTGDITISEDAFAFAAGDLAFLLVHEQTHVVQGMVENEVLRNKPWNWLPYVAYAVADAHLQFTELESDAYGCANTTGRRRYFAGAYGVCGVRRR